jgi:hypothetical protein
MSDAPGPIEPEPYESLPPALQAILRQADADREAGLTVSDSRRPGVRFSPQAAGALLALEAEEALRGEDPPA